LITGENSRISPGFKKTFGVRTFSELIVTNPCKMYCRIIKTLRTIPELYRAKSTRLFNLFKKRLKWGLLFLRRLKIFINCFVRIKDRESLSNAFKRKIPLKRKRKDLRCCTKNIESKISFFLENETHRHFLFLKFKSFL
jgi:hypothetical protein